MVNSESNMTNLKDTETQVTVLDLRTLPEGKCGNCHSVRISVSSPYIEVRMDTSGPYALVKARTDTSGIYTPTRHTGHAHTLHVTYMIDKHSLRAQFTRSIYTIRTIFTSTLYAYNLRP